MCYFLIMVPVCVSLTSTVNCKGVDVVEMCDHSYCDPWDRPDFLAVIPVNYTCRRAKIHSKEHVRND